MNGIYIIKTSLLIKHVNRERELTILPDLSVYILRNINNVSFSVT